VVQIGENAFGNCVSLTDARFGAGSQLVELGRRAFGLTSIRNFDGPPLLAKVGAALFSSSKVERVTFPEKVAELPPLLFFSCGALQQARSKNPKAVKACEQAFEEANLSYSIHKTNPELFSGSDLLPVTGQRQSYAPRPNRKYERAPTHPWRFGDKPLEDEDRERMPGWQREGANAIVYKARHRTTGLISAVKELKPPTSDKDMEKQNTDFFREIEAMATVVHPAVLGLIGAVMPTDPHYGKIVTEFMENGSMNEFITSPGYAKRSPTLKAKIAVGVAAAMNFLHQKGLMHRDLKPANILLDENFEPRVGDFGSARNFFMSLSFTGAGFGTIYYMAPELFCENPDYSCPVDVYAYGFTLWEILTGIPMSKEFLMNPWAFTKEIKEGTRPTLDRKDIHLPDWVKALLSECWSHNPSDRPTFQLILARFEANGFSLLSGVESSTVQDYLNGIKAFESAHSD
jgi:tRNA A-37 threonylcarbamoyl transferase component Bud32